MPHKVLQRTYSTCLQRLRARVPPRSRRQLRPVLQPPIECTDRDAPFVLDGVLYHESDLDLEVGCLEQHGTAVGTGLLPVKGGHERLAAELRERNALSPFSPIPTPPTSPPWVSCADSGRRSRPTGASRGFVLASTACAFVGAERRAPRASRARGCQALAIRRPLRADTRVGVLRRRRRGRVFSDGAALGEMRRAGISTGRRLVGEVDGLTGGGPRANSSLPSWPVPARPPRDTDAERLTVVEAVAPRHRDGTGVSAGRQQAAAPPGARLRRDRHDAPPLAAVDLKTVVEHCGLTLVAGCLPCSRNIALDADAIAARFGWVVPVTEIRRRLRCRRCGNRTPRLLLGFWPDRAERTVCAARARRRAGAVAAQTDPEEATGHEGGATYASAP